MDAPQGNRPAVRMWKKMMLATLVFGVGVLAFCWGRHGALSVAKANPPGDRTIETATPVSHSDYGQRVVAYIYNNVPITREELGEYLIARFGEQRLDFLVNHRIIDMACKAKGVVITEQMVNVEFQENLKNFGLKGPDAAKDFQEKLLRRWGKTLFEWREDVIRPKLALRELARPRVVVTEQDLRDAFEAHYGPMVKCRMILVPAGTPFQEKAALLTKVQADEKAFMEEARKQAFEPLRAKEGVVPPIHKHFPDKDIERAAFSLKVGGVSGLIGLPDRSDAILRCEELVAPNGTKIYETERLALKKEVDEAKLQQEIPKMFEEMRKQAQPRFIMGDHKEDLINSVQRELQQAEYSMPPLLPPKK